MKANEEVEETPPSFLPLALDREERSAPHPIRFTSGEKPPVAGGLQRQSGRCGEENTLLPLRRGAASSPVTIPPELSKLTYNNRCGYQSITQQYLKKKRCLIKDDSNYMFRPNVAIIRLSSESIVVVLYRIGMGMSRW